MKKRGDGIWNLLCGIQDAWSGWLCVLLVGIAAGSIAAVIDIGNHRNDALAFDTIYREEFAVINQ